MTSQVQESLQCNHLFILQAAVLFGALQLSLHVWPGTFITVTYLDCAALAENDSHSTHVDHHGPHIGDLLITSPVFILGVHSEVWQVGGDVTRFGQGVGAGSHIMVGVFVKCGVVGITRYWADTVSWTGEGRIELNCVKCSAVYELHIPHIPLLHYLVQRYCKLVQNISKQTFPSSHSLLHCVQYALCWNNAWPQLYTVLIT